MSCEGRNRGADHVGLGDHIGTWVFEPTAAWQPDGVAVAEPRAAAVDADQVSPYWRRVITAQAELLDRMEQRCLAGAGVDDLQAELAELLNLVTAMDAVVFGEWDASKAALYAKDRLHRYWLQCPYVARAYAKPLGYAGDYLLMHWMYEGSCHAQTRLGEVLCHAYLAFPVVQAGVSRIGWLESHLAARLDRIAGVPRIASLACGPAAEVARLLASVDRPIEVVLLDQDDDALNFCARRFASQQEQGQMHPDSSVTLRQVAVRQILKDADAVRGAVGTFDVLWAVGLFDYLPTPAATRLVAALRTLLKPGGTLIVGNFAPHVCSSIMDTIADWRLCYRDPAALAALGPAGARLHAEPVGLMWFLEVDAER